MQPRKGSDLRDNDGHNEAANWKAEIEITGHSSPLHRPPGLTANVILAGPDRAAGMGEGVPNGTSSRSPSVRWLRRVRFATAYIDIKAWMLKTQTSGHRVSGG